jgi:hypothetical protein
LITIHRKCQNIFYCYHCHQQQDKEIGHNTESKVTFATCRVNI